MAWSLLDVESEGAFPQYHPLLLRQKAVLNGYCRPLTVHTCRDQPVCRQRQNWANLKIILIFKPIGISLKPYKVKVYLIYSISLSEKASPLEKHNALEIASIPESTETPFKNYPLPFSPFKSISYIRLRATPLQQQSPLRPLSCLEPGLDENDISAISPCIFPLRAKMVDYLDIMADMERQFLMSPVKIDHLTSRYAKRNVN